MENKQSLAWGTCWFNESPSMIINFLKNSLQALRKYKIKVCPVVFVANHKFDYFELENIKKEIEDVEIIINKIDIYPNKNYGVAKIVSKAKENNYDYTAIVDSDWAVEQIDEFIKRTIKNLSKNTCDLIIPNIGMAAGRSNVIIGKTAISLFYPEYFEEIKTVFPGSIIGKTSKLYEIISDKGYHYDWGGEWDLFALAVEKKFKIESILFNTKNQRHRANTSKIYDAFQIWRAIFSIDEMSIRLNKIQKPDCLITKKTLMIEKLFENKYNIMEQIEIVEKYFNSETEQQLLYLVLYPIAFLLGEMNSFNIINSRNKKPYKKCEINDVFQTAKWCVYCAIYNCNRQNLLNNAKVAEGAFLSKWNKK